MGSTHAAKSVYANAWRLSNADLPNVDAARLGMGLDMTLLDVLLVVFVIAFITVLVKAADSLTGTEDEDGYNSERGVEKDHHTSRVSDENTHCQRATGCGTCRCKS